MIEKIKFDEIKQVYLSTKYSFIFLFTSKLHALNLRCFKFWLG